MPCNFIAETLEREAERTHGSCNQIGFISLELQKKEKLPIFRNTRKLPKN